MSENITTRLKRYFSSFAGSNSENQFVSILKNIPCSIEKETADRAIKRPIQALVPNSSLEGYNPPVFISYATGTRPGQDEKSCGPGMYYCKALVDGLLSIGCETFTGLHILPGYDWEIYLEKLERNVARILLVVMTPAVFQSRPCLNEIYISLKKGIKIIPLVFEYPFSCPNPWPHPEDVEKRDYVTCGLGKLNSYPVPPSTMLDDPEYHLSRVFQLVNSTLISILTRENLPAVMNSSSSSDSESSSSDAKPPFKIISINLGGAPLNVRKNPTWEKFLKSDADVLESNLTKIYSIATKRRIKKRIKVNPFHDSSGMERAVIKLDFQLRIKEQLSSDDYEDISRHLENIRELLAQGLIELLGKTPDETKDILARMGFKTVWPGSVNIMIFAPPGILSLLYHKLLESDGSITIGKQRGGNKVRILRMDPVFEIIPQTRKVAKLLVGPLIKAFESDTQQADLYVMSHGEVGMFISNTVATSFAIFEEASSWKLGDKLPKIDAIELFHADKSSLGMSSKITIPTAALVGYVPAGVTETIASLSASLDTPGKDGGRLSKLSATAKSKNEPVWPPSLSRFDSEKVLGVMGKDDDGIPIIPNPDNDNKASILYICQRYGLSLKYASKRLRNDKEVVQTACRENGLAIQYASEVARNDNLVARSACQQNSLALQYASEKLRNDKGLVCSTCQQNGLALQFASAKLRNDEIAVGTACRQNGLALQYASEELREDRLMVLIACNQNGLALQYAPEELRSDKKVVKTACQQNGLAFQYASEVLRNDKAFLETMLHFGTPKTVDSYYETDSIKSDLQ